MDSLFTSEGRRGQDMRFSFMFTLFSIMFISVAILAVTSVSLKAYALNENSTDNSTQALLGYFSLSDLFDKVKNSVVQITVSSQNPLGSGLGSGFVYDK